MSAILACLNEKWRRRWSLLVKIEGELNLYRSISDRYIL